MFGALLYALLIMHHTTPPPLPLPLVLMHPWPRHLALTRHTGGSSGRGALLGHVGHRFKEGSRPTLLESGSYISGLDVGSGGSVLAASAYQAGVLGPDGTSPYWIVSALDGTTLKMVAVKVALDLRTGKGFVRAIDAR